VTGFLGAAAKAESAVQDAIENSKLDPNNVNEQLDKFKPIAEGLKTKNLFSPPLPKVHPVQAVMGIFGDEAYIKGKWYKAGAKVQDATILAIGPTSVEIEWNGQKKKFLPIDAGSAQASGGPRPGRSARSSGASAGARAEMVVTQSGAGPRRAPGGVGGPGMGGMGGGPGGMRERFQNMSEGDRDRFRREMEERRERYMNMSEPEREKFRNEMRERFGGGRGPGGGRSGRR
jgi:hypothetical protein